MHVQPDLHLCCLHTMKPSILLHCLYKPLAITYDNGWVLNLDKEVLMPDSL